jgi:hypothetical protein
MLRPGTDAFKIAKEMIMPIIAHRADVDEREPWNSGALNYA